MKNVLKLDVDSWFGDKRIRMCSPAARGFLVDIRCLCIETGYLHVDGRPLSDEQIARLIGEQLKDVRKWLGELGEAGAYSVSDDGLYFEDLVANASFIEQARASGAKGGKARANGKAGGQDSSATESAATVGPNSQSARTATPPASKKRGKPAKKKAAARPHAPALSAASSDDVEIPAAAAAPARKGVIKPFLRKPQASPPRDWWETPAGWVRKAQEQSIGWNPDTDDLADLQVALCVKLPPGPWLEEPYISKRQRKLVNSKLPQIGGNYPKEVR